MFNTIVKISYSDTHIHAYLIHIYNEVYCTQKSLWNPITDHQYTKKWTHLTNKQAIKQIQLTSSIVKAQKEVTSEQRQLCTLYKYTPCKFTYTRFESRLPAISQN